MPKLYAEFDQVTGDCIGYHIKPMTFDGDWGDSLTDKVEIEERMGRSGDYMLDSQGTIVARLTFPEFDKASINAGGVDVATITDLPVGTNAIVFAPSGDQAVTVNDSTLEVTCVIPFNLLVSLRADNYKYAERLVEVV